jgi:beta-carotene 3-hydroxylase
MALWYFHEDHHQPKYEHPFERNDIFFINFANSMLYFGAEAGFNYLFFYWFGHIAYGLSYFMIHDVLIHPAF